MAHQKPGPKKPRSHFASISGTSTAAATARLTSSASDADEPVRARREPQQERRARTARRRRARPPAAARDRWRTTPPRSSKPSRRRPQPLMSSALQPVQQQADAGGDPRRGSAAGRRGSPGRGRRPAGRSTAVRWRPCRRRPWPPAWPGGMARSSPEPNGAAPGLTMSPVMMPGTPAAATTMSACARAAARSRVPVWHRVTVAFSVRRVSSRPERAADRDPAADHDDLGARRSARRGGGAAR